ncbi:hypothetical protein [Amycolatopsis rubida]|uniref:Uncharacterized protein n=1 Tax=Amycolatopsis rubida TaxID=112413 RepID=A0A1I6BIC6_9PSEU|nr:hypothetical protein [Amycolatopsis rubida]SFQ80686.1 hypothetical protein SAMN05421854_12828 [Amycolatopsis rubida]
MSEEHSDDHEAGSFSDSLKLAEEIRLLVEMVIERAAPWLEGVMAAGHGSPEDAGAPGASGVEDSTSGCGWCPLCAIVAVVRGERPEFVAKVLEQAAQLVALLRAVLADRWEPEEGVHMPGFRPAAHPPATAAASSTEPSSRIQHIVVRKRADWQPEREN